MQDQPTCRYGAHIQPCAICPYPYRDADYENLSKAREARRWNAPAHGPLNLMLQDGLCQSWRRCRECHARYSEWKAKVGADAMVGF